MSKPTKESPPVFTHDELVVINNALNEICNGLPMDDGEFQTRIGATRSNARVVLKKVAKALESQRRD